MKLEPKRRPAKKQTRKCDLDQKELSDYIVVAGEALGTRITASKRGVEDAVAITDAALAPMLETIAKNIRCHNGLAIVPKNRSTPRRKRNSC